MNTLKPRHAIPMILAFVLAVAAIASAGGWLTRPSFDILISSSLAAFFLALLIP